MTDTKRHRSVNSFKSFKLEKAKIPTEKIKKLGKIIQWQTCREIELDYKAYDHQKTQQKKYNQCHKANTAAQWVFCCKFHGCGDHSRSNCSKEEYGETLEEQSS